MPNETTQPTLFDAPPNGHTEVSTHQQEKRPGYQFVKRIGWIPEDWRVKPIKSTGKVITGATPSTNRDEYFGGPHPFVGPGDLGAHRSIAKAERSLTEEGLAQGRTIPAGSTLFTCISFAIGKTGQAAVPLATNQQINSVVPNARHNADFLYYLLTFLSGRIKRLAGIQATPILNKTEFSKVKLPLPPLPEQRKIARILGAWDRALADVDALLAAKRRRKHGLAQRLLTGRVRLPGYEGRRVPMRPLSTFFRHFSKRNKQGRDLTVLSCSKVYGIVPQTEIFDKRVASADTSRYKVVQRGDLVYDPMLLWDASIGFSDAADEGVISPAYATFHLNEETASRAFFRHFFDSHY
ncbi:MAG: restriction endonuclease subunit S, partial [Bacteroidota bacterium]